MATIMSAETRLELPTAVDVVRTQLQAAAGPLSAYLDT
jgi:hypothetical protein